MVSLINDLIVWHAGYKQTEGHSFVSAEVSAFSSAHLASVTELAYN